CRTSKRGPARARPGSKKIFCFILATKRHTTSKMADLCTTQKNEGKAGGSSLRGWKNFLTNIFMKSFAKQYAKRDHKARYTQNEPHKSMNQQVRILNILN